MSGDPAEGQAINPIFLAIRTISCHNVYIYVRFLAAIKYLPAYLLS